MNPLLERTLPAWFAATALCVAAGAAAQAPWPNKPVRFIVPFPPGGTVDPLARLVGARLTNTLGQQFVVDNRPGASGSLGASLAAKSNADGYTFLWVFDTHGVNPSLIPNLPFDTVKDFDPIMLIATSAMVVVTHPTRPFKTFGEVVAAAKAKPGTVTYGSIGSGSLGHLTTTLLQQTGGFKLIHVPYKGGGPLTIDTLGGQLDSSIATIALFATHIKGGRVRPLAVTGDRRSPVLPDVPTLAEQGFPGFSALAWWAVFAPAGTPKPILDKFHGEVAAALRQPEVTRQLSEQFGMDMQVSSPEVLRKFLAGEINRWGRVVKENAIKAD